MDGGGRLRYEETADTDYLNVANMFGFDVTYRHLAVCAYCGLVSSAFLMVSTATSGDSPLKHCGH
jgi:hypothetical protein